MKLTELEAEFVCDADNGNALHRQGATAAGAQGVLLDCPCGTGHAILVWFKAALGGGPPASDGAVPLPRWIASGSSLADLTLSPSVNAGCWHGWIQNGDVT